MCKFVRFRTGSVSSSHPFSCYLSPISSPSLLFVEVVGTVLHGFGRCKCCTQVPSLCVAGVPSPGLVLPPQTPILHTLANNEHRRSLPAGAGLHSYFHHIVLGLDKVGCLAHTLSRSSIRVVSQPLSFFPVLPSMSTLPEFVISHPSYPVYLCIALCARC